MDLHERYGLVTSRSTSKDVGRSCHSAPICDELFAKRTRAHHPLVAEPLPPVSGQDAACCLPRVRTDLLGVVGFGSKRTAK